MEELWDADDAGSTDQIRRFGVDQTGGEDVEVVGLVLNNDGVTSIVSTSATADERELVGQDVHQLALACQPRWSAISSCARRNATSNGRSLCVPSSPNWAPNTTVVIWLDCRGFVDQCQLNKVCWQVSTVDFNVRVQLRPSGA